jgi:plastocyanin
MHNRQLIIFLLCLTSIAVLIAGCTSQPGGQVTPPATTIPPTATPVPTGTASIPTTIITTPTTAGGETTGTPPTIKTGTPTTAPGSPTVVKTEDKGARVKIKAKNFAFDLSTITVPAGSTVIVEFENEDQAPHNVAFYTTSAATTTIYKGEIFTGPKTVTYTFSAPATPGTYFFRCDVHPSMQGQFIVT